MAIFNSHSNKRYLVLSLIFVIIGIPAISQLGGFLAILLTEQSRHLSESAVFIITAALCLIPPTALSYLFGKKTYLPDTFSVRYLPFLIPIIYLLTIWVIAMAIGQGDFSNEHFTALVFFAFIPFFFLNLLMIFNGAWWYALLIPLASYTLSLCAFSWAAWQRQCFTTRGKPQVTVTFSLLIILASVCSWQAYQRSTIMTPDQVRKSPSISEEIDLRLYEPFSPDGHNQALTKLRGESTLHITDHYPRLDGATAFYPVYAAAVQGTYTNPAPANPAEQSITDFVQCTTTPNAYQRLMNGETDLIFAAAPSAEQKKQAQAKGLTLQMIPVAREAFVFLVNKHNPVSDLSIEQIQHIYSGTITDWREVGGNSNKIYAFQRPKGSGSQSTMINKVMQNTPLRPPLMEEYAQGMGGLVHEVARYRNADAAIGYSFRYYTTAMQKNHEIHLLSINGIAPTRANIANGRYPFTVDVYMVTARPVSDRTQQLINWFLSDQGQHLVEDVGYVPLHKS